MDAAFRALTEPLQGGLKERLLALVLDLRTERRSPDNLDRILRGLGFLNCVQFVSNLQVLKKGSRSPER